MKFSSSRAGWVLRVFGLGLAGWSQAPALSARGGEIDYVEAYALAGDRAQALKQLIPGTENYYYYNCLHLLQTEQLDKCAELSKTWRERLGETPLWRQIQHRHALLGYRKDPRRSLDYLIRHLGLAYDHQRQVPGAKTTLPTTLDGASISRDQLRQRDIAPHAHVDLAEDGALRWLAAEPAKLSNEQRRSLLNRLQRPDLPNLVDLIVADLDAPHSGGFGSLGIHRNLTAEQLDELARRKPDLRRQQNWVLARVTRLLPGADAAFPEDLKVMGEYLDRLVAFVRPLDPVMNPLKANAYFHKLQHNRMTGKLDKALLLEYLTLPRQRPYMAPRLLEGEAAQRYPAPLGNDYSPSTQLPPVFDDERLVRAILLEILATAESPAEFRPYLEEGYLRILFAEAKITRGLGDPERWASEVSPEFYRELRDRVDIDFAPNSSLQFAPGDAVSLDLTVKNVPSLLVQVYEVNAVHHYKTRQTEIDTDLPLDGLVAGKTLKLEFTESPFKRVDRRLDLPELKGSGVWVVDLIGAGRSSRALIRKGKLRPQVTVTPAGQAVRVIDEAGKAVNDATVWLSGKQYKGDESGVILLPYASSPGRKPLVLERGNQASLEMIDHLAESYGLSAGFHVERESLLARGQAELLVRAQLTLAGKPVSKALLEDVRLHITAVNLDGISTTQEVKDFKLGESREATHLFQTPDRLASLSFRLTGKVRNQSEAREHAVEATGGLTVNGTRRTQQRGGLHLVRDAAGYSIELLGRTGEPIADMPTRLKIKHRDFRNTVDTQLQSDAEGRIRLGDLKTLELIDWVEATSQEGATRRWSLPRPDSVRPVLVHARAGEPVVMPADGVKPVDQQITVLETRAGVFRADSLRGRSAGKVSRVEGGSIVLEGLPAGDHEIFFLESRQKTLVRVIDGGEVNGWVVGRKRMGLLERLKPARVAEVKVGDEAVEVRLADATQFSRAHVLATRYVPDRGAYEALSGIRPAPLDAVNLSDQQSAYVTGRDIGDEYRYVLDRRTQAKFAGVMMERPSLLVNPWSIRPTETGVQEAAEGGQFAPKGVAPPSAAAAAPAPDPMSRAAGDGSPDLDFLAAQAGVLTNLAPDQNGVIRIPRNLLGRHGLTQLVLVDPLTTVGVVVDLPGSAVGSRDLRLAKSLDAATRPTKQKRVTLLQAGQELVLEDASSSRLEVVDTIAKAHQMLGTLAPDGRWAEFAFLTRWDKLKEAEKKELYSKHACHELALFIARKDLPFFEAVVKPHLAQKKEKTFLDRYLTGADLAQDRTVWGQSRLNTLERVLLGRAVQAEMAGTTRLLEERVKLIPPQIERQWQLFDTAVSLSGLAAGQNVEALGLRLEDRSGAKPQGMGEGQRGVDAMGRAFGMPAAPGMAPGGGGGGFMGGPGGPTGGLGGALGGMAGRPGGSGRGGEAGGDKPGQPGDGAELKRETPARAGKDIAKAKEDSKARFMDAEKEQSDLSVEESRKLSERLDEADKKAQLGSRMARRESGNDALFFRDNRRRESALEQLYRPVAPTTEWAENNYDRMPIGEQKPELVPAGPFWLDLAKHDGKTPFLSKHLADASHNVHEALLALAMIDLPFEAAKAEVKFDGARMTHKSGGPAIVYHEEIRPSQAAQGKLPILVSQNLFDPADRFRTENGEKVDHFLGEEALVQRVLGCQVVVTNPSSSRQRLSVLTQIPEGAMPLNGGQVTKATPVDLEPFRTQTLEYYFYFPKTGKFNQCPAQVAKDERVVASGSAQPLNVVEKLSKVDTGSWDHVSQMGTADEVVAYLDKANLQETDLGRIAWRMADKAYFERVLGLLRARKTYHPVLWSYALKHDSPEAAREFLSHQEQLARETGGWIACSLVDYDPVALKFLEHLEYKPLVHARAHALGKNRQIVNARILEQYHQLMRMLALKPAPGNEDWLQVAYYLLLQDRVAEAIEAHKRVPKNAVATAMQHDLMGAWLAMAREDLDGAEGIAAKYASYPVDRWRAAFALVGEQVAEARGKAPTGADGKPVDDPLLRQATQASKEPALTAELVGGKLRISHRNIQRVTMNLYEMDVELLFSRNPFSQQFGDRFALVRPNQTVEVDLPGDKAQTEIELPARFASVNTLVELKGGGKTFSLPRFARTMNVATMENNGQLKVTTQDGKPLAKAYVKVYARHADGRVRFHKDGYTDIRGRFDHASVSGPPLPPVEKFAILVLDEKHGALIQEVAAPAR